MFTLKGTSSRETLAFMVKACRGEAAEWSAMMEEESKNYFVDKGNLPAECGGGSIVTKMSLPQKRKLEMTIFVLLAFVLVMVVLAACAPNQDATEKGGSAPLGDTKSAGGDPAITTDWSVDSDCTVCHTKEGGTVASIACVSNASGNVQCTTCHTEDGDTMKSVHEGATAAATMPKRLKKTEIPDATCLSCHFETRDALIAATEGATAVTDTNGLQQNPHNPASGSEHEIIDCATCHNPHAATDVQTNAEDACLSCHHAGVYECGTCHAQ